MNTPSNKVKAQFFALYLGQKVEYLGMVGELSIDEPDIIIRVGTHKFINEAVLQLRSVDKLTDEECKIVYTLRDIQMDEGGSRNDFSYIRHQLTLWMKYGNLDYLNYQYLLRIGILLPFTYLSEDNKPITLSPSDLIQLGWVKMEKEL